MKSATVRELRNEFPRIEAWIREGEAVSITKRGSVIAVLTAPSKALRAARVQKPDIMARLRETWGDRVFTRAEVDAMSAAELAGEEG
jgi:antitoxin (DNA-binding transcriptional repressor) of toxin-antitoxin stability system